MTLQHLTRRELEGDLQRPPRTKGIMIHVREEMACTVCRSVESRKSAVKIRARGKEGL